MAQLFWIDQIGPSPRLREAKIIDTYPDGWEVRTKEGQFFVLAGNRWNTHGFGALTPAECLDRYIAFCDREKIDAEKRSDDLSRFMRWANTQLQRSLSGVIDQPEIFRDSVEQQPDTVA